jgi:hypothetical protein
LISTGIACLGSGSLLREADHQEEGPDLELVAKALAGLAAILGIALAAAGGASNAIVDAEEVIGTEISGGFSHLGLVGWLLGVPLFLGAAAIVFSGARMSLARGDGRGLWLWCSGVFFALWPLDLWLRNLPLTPALLLLGMVMTYFGFQEPQEEGMPGKAEESSRQAALEAWLEQSSITKALGEDGEPKGQDDEGGNDEPDPSLD